MKPEELSIGDWVNVLNYHWDGSPYTGQVKGIKKKHGTYYLQFSRALSAEIDRCEPIPITPEILEKNGFDTMGKCYSLLELDEQTWLEYYWHEHRLQRKWHGVDEWNNHAEVNEVSFECQCHYVHELQHALILCGINKNIEL